MSKLVTVMTTPTKQDITFYRRYFVRPFDC